jgi:hypothetical protein
MLMYFHRLAIFSDFSIIKFIIIFINFQGGIYFNERNFFMETYKVQ